MGDWLFRLFGRSCIHLLLVIAVIALIMGFLRRDTSAL